MRWQLHFRLRTLILSVAVFSLALAYVGSYYRLSRRGMREAILYGLDPGFLYVPFEEAAEKEDRLGHHALRVFYYPANWVDQRVFGGPPPIICIMWRLSG